MRRSGLQHHRFHTEGWQADFHGPVAGRDFRSVHPAILPVSLFLRSDSSGLPSKSQISNLKFQVIPFRGLPGPLSEFQLVLRWGKKLTIENLPRSSRIFSSRNVVSVGAAPHGRPPVVFV